MEVPLQLQDLLLLRLASNLLYLNDRLELGYFLLILIAKFLQAFTMDFQPLLDLPRRV